MKRKFLHIMAAILALTLLAATTASAMRPIESEQTPENENTAVSGAPIARDLTLKTFRNIPVAGRFEAVDPEGKDLTFSIATKPEKGTITTFKDTSYFVYTPAEDKTGTDSFTYTASDPDGKVSAPATVSIRIDKPSTKVVYSDMAGNPAHYAALRLIESGIFIGERIGANYRFSPETTVTRGEFVAMVMNLMGTECADAETATAFVDDGDIESWLRPYVNAALKAGMLRGSSGSGNALKLLPNKPITHAEAAVLLDGALALSDAAGGNVSTAAYIGGVPAWAYQSALNVASCGIVADASLCSDEPLTRADAAQMLLGALEVLNERAAHTGGLLSWAK